MRPGIGQVVSGTGRLVLPLLIPKQKEGLMLSESLLLKIAGTVMVIAVLGLLDSLSKTPRNPLLAHLIFLSQCLAFAYSFQFVLFLCGLITV